MDQVWSKSALFAPYIFVLKSEQAYSTTIWLVKKKKKKKKTGWMTNITDPDQTNVIS